MGVKSGCIYTYTNRVVRDPYATWCERRTSSVKNPVSRLLDLAVGRLLKLFLVVRVLSHPRLLEKIGFQNLVLLNSPSQFLFGP